MEPVSGQLADAVQQLSRRLRHGARLRLAPLGLTPGQGRALSVLERAGGPMRMAELAEALRVVPRSATDVVEGLEEAGLARRATDPDNRRSVLVTLTDQGRGTLDELAAARRQTAEELFGTLTPDDQRRLLALLTTLDQQ
ncbi:MAG TPA: MarR family transcriptional regulator [Mycobacteriales bacterium]|jgi:DNA-binding MarR family transcriptional regulator|nr:MarR family transcriptional regulator [Mycobacteriales bacterium]